MKYQRFLTPTSNPFDPLDLAKDTEKIVTKTGPGGLERKYTDFYSVPVYGGIATGYAVGCCLRCIYCWSNWSRDFPERFGMFYSPKVAVQRLFKAAEDGIVYSDYWGRLERKVEKLRLSGCEPTIGKEHLLLVLQHVQDSKYPLFILETNGVLFGADRNYVRSIAEYRSKLYVRVSFKAATRQGFTRRTGAIGKYYNLPFRALRYLLDEGIYVRAAAMTDPEIMPIEEREILIEKLSDIDASYKRGELEEEKIDAYKTSIERLKGSEDSEFARKLEKRLAR